MSLTAARGPLGPDPAGRFSSPLPKGLVFVEPHPRRIQARRGDDVVIDTEAALLVHRVGRPLSYVFPAELIWDLPHEPEPEAPGYVHVPWDAVDTWIEEGRRLVHYPPNPYHRVDCRPTRRQLLVTLADTTLVDTDDTLILFETSLEPKLYVDKTAVRMDLPAGRGDVRRLYPLSRRGSLGPYSRAEKGHAQDAPADVVPGPEHPRLPALCR